MGNLMSCKTSTGGGHLMIKKYHYSGKIAAARVMLPTGEVRAVEEPTKVAELMMEAPNYMVVNADALQVGARLSPLAADHDLEIRNLYVMLPMQRKHSVITPADLSLLFLSTADSLVVVKRRGPDGKVRDLPPAPAAPETDQADPASYPRLQISLLQGLDDDDESSVDVLAMHRLSMSRSRKPLLDTIVEEPPAAPARRRRGSIC